MLVEDVKIIVAIHAKEKKEEISHHGTIWEYSPYINTWGREKVVQEVHWGKVLELKSVLKFVWKSQTCPFFFLSYQGLWKVKGNI